MCVCYYASCYIPCLYVENMVLLGFSWHFQHMHCVDFVEVTLFKSSDDIFQPPPPSSLLDKLLVDSRDSDGFFSRKLVCRSSDSSYNSIDKLLIIVDYQQGSLPLNQLIWHTRGADGYYVIQAHLLWLL